MIESSLVAKSLLTECEKAYEKLQASGRSVEELIPEWFEYKGTCQGTGLYEYRLSKLYIHVRDYDKASRVIEEGLQHNTSYNKELLHAKGDIFLREKEYAKAEQAYRVVTKKFPDWYFGFSYLGFSVFAQGKNQEAVDLLNKANTLQESAYAYRTLTLAHHLLQNHDQCIDAFNRAYSLDESLFSDRDPMVAASRSYAEIGKFEVSRNLLILLIDKKSEMEDDKQVQKALAFLTLKLDQAGMLDEGGK